MEDAEGNPVYPGDKVWIKPCYGRKSWFQMTVSKCFKRKIHYTEPDPYQGYDGARWNLVYKEKPQIDI